MLSVVILTKNEEKNIIDCLETVLWADEIIIIDDYSEDRTIEVVKGLRSKKIKIYQNYLNEDFSKQRNFGLSKTTKPWVLFIDADERISDTLKEEINSKIVNRDDSNTGYLIKRIDVIWDKKLKHGETGSLRLLRFAKRNSGIWMGKVHEIWQIDGKLGEFEGEVIHFPHQSVNEFLTEINQYSSIRADELFSKGVTTSTLQIFFYPLAKLLINYVLKVGFLDGTPGLVVAIMMSFHSFLVRSKLWLLWQKK